MHKVVGAIMLLLGTLIFVLMIFLYLNKMTLHPYNAEDAYHLSEAKVVIPGIFALGAMIAGIVFLKGRDPKDIGEEAAHH